MAQKITLYTSWEGQMEWAKGRNFIAYTQHVAAHTRAVTVCESHILFQQHTMRLVSSESDAVFA